jgi:hypothetical protein
VSSPLESLRAEIIVAHRQLTRHPVFSAIADLDDLRQFMEWHAFAVWDFMTLLKRLQRDLTGVSLPWTPPANPRAARLINEIVLAEESDLLPDGGALSHFELYLAAMREIGAETAQIESFVEQLKNGISLEAALARAGLAAPVAAFVRSTLQTAMNGEIEQVLGSFFFGRENVIPAMFQGLLQSWKLDPQAAPQFVHYLSRHIEIDQEHGKMTEAIIEEIVGDDPKRQEGLLNSALAALRQRHALWNALHERIVNEPRREVAE